jgi:hypothetical protein
MKHLLKIIRNKKTPKPSHQVVSPGNASNIVPGPSDLASGLTAVPEGAQLPFYRTIDELP